MRRVNQDNIFIGTVYLDNLLDILKPHQAKLLKNLPFVEIDEDVFDLEVAPSMGELLLVDDIMDTGLLSLKDSVTLEKAYSFMRLHNKNRLPVVDKDSRLLGIIGLFDIIWRMFKEKGVV